MDENDIESPAQDPNAPEGQPEVDAAAKAQQEGIEKRIAELTAKAAEAERRAQAMAEQNMALTAAALTAPRAHSQEVADEFEDVDPAVKRMMAKITGDMKRDHARQMAEANGRLEVMQIENEVRASTAAAGVDATIRERAVQLAVNLRKKGIPLSAEDATTFALGEAVKSGTYAPQGTVQNPQQTRRGAPPMSAGPRAPNLTPRAAPRALPNNFNELTPDQQLAIFDKNGTGDEPF